jgi:hypothetical protein
MISRSRRPSAAAAILVALRYVFATRDLLRKVVERTASGLRG